MLTKGSYIHIKRRGSFVLILRLGGYKMKKSLLFVLFLVLLMPALHAQYTALLDDRVELDNEAFIKAVVEADTIFIAQYIQGGQTRARVRVTENIFGEASGDVVVTSLDKEKLRRRFRVENFQKGKSYIFFTNKKGGEFDLLEDSVTVPVTGQTVNFSFAAPYMMNFWIPFNVDLFKVGVSAIKESADNLISDSTRQAMMDFAGEYYGEEKKDVNSLKSLLQIAYISGIRLFTDSYEKYIENTSSLGCLAVKYSAKIMGSIYLNQNVLPKVKEMPRELQMAFSFAAIEAVSKEGATLIGNLLKNSDMYTPPVSECFPYSVPVSNKELFVRAIIEIAGPDTLQILTSELQTNDTQWLAVALNIIAEYEGADLVELVLNAATTETSSEKRFLFAGYFDKIKSPETAKTFLKIFNKNNNTNWKRVILTSLGRYQYKESLAFLIKVMNEDPQEEIRTTAAMSIGQLNAVEGIKPLYEFIMKEKSLLAKTIAIDAMKNIADKSVQDFLRQIIKEADNPRVREVAVNALEDNLFILRYGRKKN
jgi:hypothetical protein